MCKLFALSDTSGLTKLQLNQLLVTVGFDFGSNQRDGFGFALRNPATKQTYCERYVKPSEFLGVGRLAATLESLGWMSQYAVYHDWNRVGDFDEFTLGGPLIAHGRTSTNKVNLANTHPFQKKDWILAHNGVVDWCGPAVGFPLETSCDSEHLLNCYAFADGVRNFHDLITGWFATVTIDPEGRLRVAKCDWTELSVAWSTAWKTFVFTTDRTLFSRLNTALNANCGSPLPLEPYVELVMAGNDLVDSTYFTEPGRSFSESTKTNAQLSLGRTIADTTATKDGFTKPAAPVKETDKRVAKKKRGKRGKKIDLEIMVAKVDWDEVDLGELDELIANLGEHRAMMQADQDTADWPATEATESGVEDEDTDTGRTHIDPDMLPENEWRAMRQMNLTPTS